MSNELVKTDGQTDVLVRPDETSFENLMNVGRFEHLMRVAKVFAASTMVPDQYQKNDANCIIAIQMSMRLGIDPFMFMQSTYIVHGKPGMEAKLAIALVNNRGPFRGPIQWKDNGKTGDEREVTAFATHKATGEVCEASVTGRMVRLEGWQDKSGSKWKTMPDIMFRYRSAMFLARLYCPEVLMGLRSVDELHDMDVDIQEPRVVSILDAEPGRRAIKPPAPAPAPAQEPEEPTEPEQPQEQEQTPPEPPKQTAPPEVTGRMTKNRVLELLYSAGKLGLHGDQMRKKLASDGINISAFLQNMKGWGFIPSANDIYTHPDFVGKPEPTPTPNEIPVGWDANRAINLVDKMKRQNPPIEPPDTVWDADRNLLNSQYEFNEKLADAIMREIKRSEFNALSVDQIIAAEYVINVTDDAELVGWQVDRMLERHLLSKSGRRIALW